MPSATRPMARTCPRRRATRTDPGSGASGRPRRLVGSSPRSARTALLALVALLATASPGPAHIVQEGVGSQTELRIGPRRIRVHYNLGFSSILGLGELKRMDRDGSGAIDAAEQEAYLDALGAQLIPGLKVSLDGEPQQLVILARRGLGILGPIEQVAFDTWWELELRCELGPGAHRLDFHEGNFEGQTAQQLLWVPLDQLESFARFEATQERAPGPPLDQQTARRFLGRDLRLDFELTAVALERDRALARLEPSLAGVEKSVEGVRAALITDLEAELDALAFRGVELGGGATGMGGSAPMISQMARDRVLDADTGGAVGTPADPGATAPAGGAGFMPESAASKEMIEALNRPFSIAVLIVFFFWGAAHALLPGHGKTMVAAYLLGTKGRIGDAFRLGGIVTFTHTFALYTAGLALVYVVETFGSAQGQSFHEKLVRHVSLLSGLGLILYGAFLALVRLDTIQGAGKAGHSHSHGGAGHSHSHSEEIGHGHEENHSHSHAGHEHSHSEEIGHGHGHGHEENHSPAHSHSHDVEDEQLAEASTEHGKTHSHGAHSHGETHSHSHGGTPHSHSHGAGMTDEEHARIHAQEAAQVTSWRDLLVLGVTGGLVPCPAGVTLVLYSLTFRSESTKKCFVYLTSFSVGLGSVLVAIALAMVLSKRLLVRGAGEERLKRSKVLLYLPVFTAGLISLVGVGVCWDAFDPGYAKLKGWLGAG